MNQKETKKNKVNMIKIKLAFENLLKNSMSKWKDNIQGLFQLCLKILNTDDMQKEFVNLIVNKFINPLPVKGGIRLVYFLDLMVDLKYPDIRNTKVVEQQDIYNIPLSDKICNKIPRVVEILTVQFAEVDELKPYWSEWTEYVNKWNNQLNRSQQNTIIEDSDDDIDTSFINEASITTGALPPRYDLSITLDVIEDSEEPPVLPVSSPLKRTVRFKKSKKHRKKSKNTNPFEDKINQYPLNVPLSKPRNRRMNDLEKTKLNRAVKQLEEAEEVLMNFMENCRSRLTNDQFEELDNIASACNMGEIEDLSPNGICKTLLTPTLLRRMKPEEEAKVRILYTWVQCHIDFELNKPRWASNVSKVLTGGRANALGMANTFSALCQAADIKCHVVQGKWKAITERGEYNETVDHYWNVVFVNNTYAHIDCSVGLIDRSSFLPDPHHFYLSHKPNDDKWILYQKRESVENWMDNIWCSSFGTNLYDIDPSIAFKNSSKDEIFSIPFKVRNGVVPGTDFDLLISYSDDSVETTFENQLKLNCCYTFERTKENAYLLNIQFPEVATYNIDFIQKNIARRVEPTFPEVEEEQTEIEEEQPKKGKKDTKKKGKAPPKKEVEEEKVEEVAPSTFNVLCSRVVVENNHKLENAFTGFAHKISKEYTLSPITAFVEAKDGIVTIPLDMSLEASPIIKLLEVEEKDEGKGKKDSKKGKGKDKAPDEPYSLLELTSEDALPVLHIALAQEGIFQIAISPELMYYCNISEPTSSVGFPTVQANEFISSSFVSLSPMQRSLPAKTDTELSFTLRSVIPSLKAKINMGKTSVDFIQDDENPCVYKLSAQFDKKAGASIEYSVDGKDFEPFYAYIVQ